MYDARRARLDAISTALRLLPAGQQQAITTAAPALRALAAELSGQA